MPETATPATQDAADAALEPLAEPEAPEQPGSAAPDATPAPDAPATQPPPDAEPGAAEPAAEPQAEPAADAPAEPTAEPEADAISAFDPFVYRAEGAEHPFPGAVTDTDGQVLFTKDAVPQLRQALSLARAYPRLNREADRNVNAERQQRQAVEEQLTTVLTKLGELFSNKDAAAEFLAQGVDGWRLLEAEAKRKGVELRAKHAEDQLATWEVERQDAEWRPVGEGMIDEALALWGPEIGLEGAEIARLKPRYMAMFDRIFPKADQDDPAAGIRKGQRYDLRQAVMADDLKFLAGFRGAQPGKKDQPRAADGTFAKAEAAKQENAKRTTPAKAPPAVGAAKGSAAPAKGPPNYKTTREADEAIWFG